MLYIHILKTRTKIVWNIDKDEFHKIPHFNLILFDLKTRFRVIKLKLQVFDYSVFHHNVEKNDEEPNLEIFNCETLFVQKRRMIVKNHFPWRLRIHHCTNKIAFFRKSTFLNYHTFVFHSFIHITCDSFWVISSNKFLTVIIMSKFWLFFLKLNDNLIE